MPKAAQSQPFERTNSPLFRLLEQKLTCCLNHEGRLNLTQVSKAIKRSRQGIHLILSKSQITPAVAYRLLEAFPKELSLDDLRPHVNDHG